MEWKWIDGYVNKYMISNTGLVKSFQRKEPKLMALEIDKDGYYKVKLNNEGGFKKFFAHRLVAMHFLTKTEGCDIVNHINENKQDNRVENLEWTTIRGNNNHGTRNERMSASKGRPVEKMKDGIVLETFLSLKEAEEKTGVKYPGISACCNGKQKTSGGYSWRYKNNIDII